MALGEVPWAFTTGAAAHWVPTAGTGYVTWPAATISATRTPEPRYGWKCPDCTTVIAPWIPEHECADTSGDPEQPDMLYKADPDGCGRCAGREVHGPE